VHNTWSIQGSQASRSSQDHGAFCGRVLLDRISARSNRVGVAVSNIDHPAHYSGSIECIDVIEQLGLGFHLGNAMKYIWRAGKKGSATEDLKKARWYLDREIERLENAS